MRISNKGLYALEAMINLAQNYPDRPTKIHEIALEEGIPEKFLELILLGLKAARLVESLRGAHGVTGSGVPPARSSWVRSSAPLTDR